MNRKSIITACLWLVVMTGCQHSNEKPSEPPYMNWQLQAAASQFSFLSTKNGDHTEEHTIRFDQGLIDQQGQLKLALDLTTVDTMIPIRDQRMRDILFEVKDFPKAYISSQLDEQMPLLKPFAVDFMLDLHGTRQSMSAQVLIQTVGDQLVVTNFEPVLVNGKDFGLDPAINQLTKIAGLRSINYEVLVDFKLVFEKAAN
ncbi:YceI family protein [Marinicella sediminis]|uniref:YceI family protein n=1 Tax=Marinicella sediminis TaxID=1792834 RepID=A0ABV7J5F1_9GAMM|nr:YceI family protein [Marinicella sediminis]